MQIWVAINLSLLPPERLLSVVISTELNQIKMEYSIYPLNLHAFAF